MVNIYTACCNAVNCDTFINEHAQYLPQTFIERANAYKFKIDAQRYLLGKILLSTVIGMPAYTGVNLEHLHVDEYHKPYFGNDIQFNISHSGNYVLCAISRNHTLGIDIEEMAAINITEFTRCFTANEWACIKNTNKPLQLFYRFWTRKEAVIKADGRGMHIPLLSFEVLDDIVTIDTCKWYIKELMIAEGYCAHLATSKDIKDNYSIQQIV